jgi:hypothetical protein
MIIAGGIYQVGQISNEIWIYNLKNKEFNKLEQTELKIPKIFGHKSIKLKKKVILLGGLESFENLSKY